MTKAEHAWRIACTTWPRCTAAAGPSRETNCMHMTDVHSKLRTRSSSCYIQQRRGAFSSWFSTLVHYESAMRNIAFAQLMDTWFIQGCDEVEVKLTALSARVFTPSATKWILKHVCLQQPVAIFERMTTSRTCRLWLHLRTVSSFQLI